MLAFGSALLVACGGGETNPKTAVDVPGARDDEGDSAPLDVTAEIGALDQDKVDQVFSASIKGLQGCLNQGARRVEFIGGAVAFFVKVDTSGQLVHAHVEQSTLGDRETEKCMLGVLRAKSWPAAVGGEVGYARKSFDFDPPNDVRPPTEWESDRVSESLDDKSALIAECKNGASGSFTATMYVSTEGEPLAVGITPPDESGEASVDCLVEIVKSTTYPKPGSWPAKVTFSL